MRSVPYNFTKPATPETTAVEPKLKERSFESSIVRDLSAEVARPIKPSATVETEPKPQPEPAKDPKTETPAPEPDKDGTAQLNEGVAKFKETIEKEIKTAIADPKRASKNVLKFMNMGRFILYPFLYKRIIFEGPELDAIDPLLKKIAEAEKANTEPVLNNFEKRVHKKWQEYEVLKRGILWTAEEIEQINEVAYLKLAEIKFLKWLMENEWAIVIIYIESKRFVPAFGSRMGFGAPDLSVL